jgi:hypothetical protein
MTKAVSESVDRLEKYLAELGLSANVILRIYIEDFLEYRRESWEDSLLSAERECQKELEAIKAEVSK